jgi:glycosyltransferase involved in cell wall biosynthesis
VDVSITTSGHDVADARLHRLTAALTAAGLRVEVSGLGRVEDGPGSAVRVRAVPRPTPARRLALAARQAVRFRGDVVVALDPDSLLAAFVASRVRRRAVVADVHEDYLALLSDRVWARGVRGTLARAVARAASGVARRADAVVVADEHVPPVGGRRRLVLRNVPYLSMLPRTDHVDDPPRAVYIGDVRASRGLFTMLDGVLETSWSLDVVGPLAPADEARARSHPAVLGGVARLHGRLPPESAWAVAQGAAVGLCLLSRTPAFVDAMPSKVYEYAACGIPVLVSDLPRQREFVEEYGCGLVLPDEADPGAGLRAALRDLSANPGRLEELRERTRTFQQVAGSWEADYAGFAALVGSLAQAVNAGS